MEKRQRTSGRSGVGSVEYSNGAFEVAGNPVFLCCAEYQYYRDRAEHWADRLQQIRAAGANAVSFYVPWRHHAVDSEAVVFDFAGESAPNRDLVRFLRLIDEQNLWAIAKPGPFVHSELNIGGLPDAASPTFDSEIEPMRRRDGSPLRWEYDRSILPAPFDEIFSARAQLWLSAVGSVVRGSCHPDGPLIAIQVNDETLYCSSNAPPWTLGYERSSLERYRGVAESATVDRWLAGYPPTSQLSPSAAGSEEYERIEWARYQAWIRRETYRMYRDWLDVPLPHLSNFAGITPPIEENVPEHDTPSFHGDGIPYRIEGDRYAEWWFAHNPIEADSDIYHYGFVSWLGVAAYNLADPKTVDPDHSVSPNTVFSRYVNTASRGRGINMEENWGFAKLYHPYSRHPFVPVFQTLVSVAGGATGFVVFCAISHDYWDDSLDRVTKRQFPWFPSDAPIRPDGTTTPMYRAMKDLNRWFGAHGESLLRCRRHIDLCFATYQPYSAITSWIDSWESPDPPPFQGYEGLESLCNAAQEYGFVSAWIGLDGRHSIDPGAAPILVVRLGRRMDPRTQSLLSSYLDSGGTLAYLGIPPQHDWEENGCEIVQEAIDRNRVRVHPLPEGLAAANAPADEVVEYLHRIGVHARLPVSPGTRAYLFERPERDRIVLFFSYDAKREQTIHCDDLSVHVAGGKCCGAVRMVGDEIRSWFVKGYNEVEETTAAVRLELAGNRIEIAGDGVEIADSAGKPNRLSPADRL